MINLILLNALLVLCSSNLDKYMWDKCQRQWECSMIALVTEQILIILMNNFFKTDSIRMSERDWSEWSSGSFSSPVLQCAQVTRPALLVLGLLRLLLGSLASLPKALLPRRTSVFIPRLVPWRTNGLKLAVSALVCESVAVLRFYLVNWTTSSRRNSSTGKVKPGMWIIGHLSVDEAEGVLVKSADFCFLCFVFSFF